MLFGGISIYLQQHLALFRKTPRFLDRLWDSPLGASARSRSRSISTDPKLLGELTISMLEGERGVLRKEFDKLLDWLADEPAPDVINLPNSLLIGLAAPLRDALKRPVCCTLQGEDLFLDGLVEPYRAAGARADPRRPAARRSFLPVSQYYLDYMPGYLGVPAAKMRLVPLGINLDGYTPRTRTRVPAPFTVGYFARVAPEKGLHVLCEAYRRLRARPRPAATRDSTSPAIWRPSTSRISTTSSGRCASGARPANSSIAARSIAHEKIAFLRASTCCRCPRPTTSRRASSCSRRWRAACRSCSRGAARSRRSSRGPAAACSSTPTIPTRWPTGLRALWRDPARAAALGAAGAAGVREHYAVGQMAETVEEIYADRRAHASGLVIRGQQNRI